MRRHPVAPQMLRWIRTGIRPEASLDGATLWVALPLGFFFLPRASEYLDPEAGERAAKGVRGADLTPLVSPRASSHSTGTERQTKEHRFTLFLKENIITTILVRIPTKIKNIQCTMYNVRTRKVCTMSKRVPCSCVWRPSFWTGRTKSRPCPQRTIGESDS